MAVVKEADFHKKDRTGLISRAEVVGKITSSEMQMSYRQMTGTEVYNEILCILNNAHDVDEEPIVRCCECDFGMHTDPAVVECGQTTTVMKPIQWQMIIAAMDAEKRIQDD